MKNILFACIACFLFSCNTQSSKETVTNGDSVHRAGTDTTKPETLEGCYTMVIGKDTATLRINGTGTALTGDLAYKRFEKDSNKGTVSFSNNGTYLKGWYTFSSEGSISVRQIYLKINGYSLAEGYGEVSAKDDSAFYTYPANLKYEEKHPFIKNACK